MLTLNVSQSDHIQFCNTRIHELNHQVKRHMKVVVRSRKILITVKMNNNPETLRLR